ncbi:MAG: M20/M25/M40 family metallo-hydrolase [Bacillota bacterium]
MFSRQSWLETFIGLATIDSPSRNERKLVDRLKGELLAYGLPLYEDSAAQVVNGSAGNLVVEVPGKEDLSTLLLSAHLDRVDPGQGIEPVVTGDYLQSKGETVLGADDLAGVTTIMELLRILHKQQIDNHPLRIIFTVAEEAGLLGSRTLKPERLAGIDYGFVLDAEGGTGTVIHRSPGKYRFNALIKGKSAHAGIAPDSGVNAIKISSLAISRMKLGQIDKETTANIGVIRGGVARNIVPDLVELEGEVRSLSPLKLQQQIEEMQSIIDHYARKFQGQVDYNIEQLYSNFFLEPDLGLFDLVYRAAAEAGLEVALRESGGGSDANIFNELGLPTVNLGLPIDNVHSTEEVLKISDMEPLMEFLLALVRVDRG